ncbi:cupin domain-containing protein [Gallaecimonas mangrovi]|uniref:cupin domain-containing protein n=1 Tax=Gallaecimonas mangrovi TaxID=2291597 RepID=UPI000E2034ED|nr:cupin domain-containing protein [Gallaecimonas mangrovi]
MKPFINLDELTNYETTDKGPFGERYAAVSGHIGAQKLGYSVTILAPNKRVCPFHSHRASEEMFLILEGEGTLRFGDKSYPIKKHDIIACPPGGPEVAHQIINTSQQDLKYLSLSTHEAVDVCEYPDSQKVKTMVGKRGKRDFEQMVRAGENLDYYDGEL